MRATAGGEAEGTVLVLDIDQRRLHGHAEEVPPEFAGNLCRLDRVLAEGVVVDRDIADCPIQRDREEILTGNPRIRGKDGLADDRIAVPVLKHRDDRRPAGGQARKKLDGGDFGPDRHHPRPRRRAARKAERGEQTRATPGEARRERIPSRTSRPAVRQQSLSKINHMACPRHAPSPDAATQLAAHRPWRIMLNELLIGGRVAECLLGFAA